MKKRRVAVTGMGAVSPFGAGVDLFWRALLDGRSAVRPIERFDAGKYRSRLGAEVPQQLWNDDSLRRRCGNPEEDAAYFAVLAAEEALAQSGLAYPFRDEDGAACIAGTLCAGANQMLHFGRAYNLTGSCRTEAASIESSLVSYQPDFLAARFNFTGPVRLVSTACSSSTDAIGLAAELIAGGECEIALAGGGDIVVEAVHAGFCSLFSIAPDCVRPFDRARKGFVIGEGAGFLVLESYPHAQARGAAILGDVLGYGLSNTASSLTAPTATGEAEAFAIERALDDAGLRPADIGYVNTHGTATVLNDLAEAKAIARVFGSHAGDMVANSIKPAIGHCMGASGVLEAISTIQSIRTGLVPPTLNTKADMEGLTINLAAASPVERPIVYAISQSFGFGGACSCVALGRADGSRGQG